MTSGHKTKRVALFFPDNKNNCGSFMCGRGMGGEKNQVKLHQAGALKSQKKPMCFSDWRRRKKPIITAGGALKKKWGN